jgi:hypothetical protein
MATILSPRLRSLVFRALLCDRTVWSRIREKATVKIRQRRERLVYRTERTLFWLESRGGDLDRIDPFHLSFRRTFKRRAIDSSMFASGTGQAVILGIGQSNIANEGDGSALYVAKGEVYNFNPFTGKCYAARDPLLGASLARSNVLTRLGDLLVARSDFKRVLLVPIGHGGTSVRNWSPGGTMFPRLEWALERLRERNIKVTHVVWQQGEAEAAEPDARAEDWIRDFTAMVRAVRGAGVDAPIFVAQCTICCNEPNEKIRAAQANVVDAAAGVFAGPDLDEIGRSDRWDGCHFGLAGLQRAAELWRDALCRH